MRKPGSAHRHIGVGRIRKGGGTPLRRIRLGAAADDLHPELKKALAAAQKGALADPGGVGEKIHHEAGRVARRRGADDRGDEERARGNAPGGKRLAEIVPLRGQPHAAGMIGEPAHAEEAVHQQPIERPEGTLDLALQQRVAEVARLVEVAVGAGHAAARRNGHHRRPCAGRRVEDQPVQRPAALERPPVDRFPGIGLGLAHGRAPLEPGLPAGAAAEQESDQPDRQRQRQDAGSRWHGRRLGAWVLRGKAAQAGSIH
jgi:hypothetical protein